LVVALRYEGDDTTPEPSVIGAEDGAGSAASAPHAILSEAKPHAEAVEAPHDDEEDDPDLDPSAMRGPVDAIAVSIGKAAQATGEKLAEASGVAAAFLTRVAKVGGTRLGEAAARRMSGSPKRRATAPAPQAPAPAGQRRLRPQNSDREKPVEGK